MQSSPTKNLLITTRQLLQENMYKKYKNKMLGAHYIFMIYVVIVNLGLLAYTSSVWSDSVKVASYDSIVRDPPVAGEAVIDNIFRTNESDVVFMPLPPKRMPYALFSGDIDTMQVSMLASECRNENDKFLTAKYPVSIVSVDVYYRNAEDWHPNWPPDEAMLNARGASINYNYLVEKGLRVNQVTNIRAGIKMVNAGRVDYWIDTISDVDPIYRQYGKSIADGYHKKRLLYNPLFFRFSDTERGRELKERWDNGISEIIKNNRYTEIFMEGVSERYVRILSPAVENYLNYMKETYPELN